MKYTINWSKGGYSHTVYSDSCNGAVHAAEAISKDTRVVAVNTETGAERLYVDGLMQWTDSDFL